MSLARCVSIRFAFGIVALTSFVACSSSSDEADPAIPSGAATAAASVNSTVVPSGAAPSGSPVSEAPAPAPVPSPATGDVGEPGPICDIVPGAESISAILAETVHTVSDLSSPSVRLPDRLMIAQRCEVTGDGIGLAIFERIDSLSGSELVAAITEQGLVQTFTDPGLPGAVAWANGVMIERGDLWWTATAITTDTVGVADAPAAYAASAALLAAWLSA